jgi:hypothetical protein
MMKKSLNRRTKSFEEVQRNSFQTLWLGRSRNLEKSDGLGWMGQSFVYRFWQPGLLENWKARSKPISVPASTVLLVNLVNTLRTHSTPYPKPQNSGACCSMYVRTILLTPRWLLWTRGLSITGSQFSRRNGLSDLSADLL